MATKEVITAKQISVMAGAKSGQYAHNKLYNDPTFPKPIIDLKGTESVWFKHEIEAWLKKRAACPKAPVGRAAALVAAEQRNSLDLALARQFFNRTREPIC